MSDGATRVPANAIPVFLGIAQNSPTPPTPFPATILAGATYDTGPIPANGYDSVSVAAQLSQTGVLTIQTYIDAAGLIPINAAVTQAMTANVIATAGFHGSAVAPYASFRVTIHNTSGSTGNLTNTAILQATN